MTETVTAQVTGSTVLVTGSSGRIGTMLAQRLPGYGWSLRGFDRVDGESITDPGALDQAMAGVSAVVHLAGQPTEGVWEDVREGNIEGTFQVFEAARRAGVRRVVYASSNHAVGFARRPSSGELAVAQPPQPDTLYGVSKVFSEALGRYYTDRYGFSVINLRIGTCDWRPTDHRTLSTWLSPDDAGRLVDAALRTQVRYASVWGVSANTRRWWSLQEGYAIGYHPQDDAEEFAAQLQEQPPLSNERYVGGGFTDWGFGIDEVRARA